MLVNRLKELQIDQQEVFKQKVPGSREITVREPGIRGVVTDRNGVILVDNKRNYELDLNLEDIHQYWKNEWAEPMKVEVLGKRAGNMPAKVVQNDIYSIVKATVVPRLEEFGLKRSISPSGVRTHFQTHRGVIGFNYINNLSYDDFAKLAENTDKIPGVTVSVRPKRIYPYGTLACHTLGYIRRWDKGNIPESDRVRFNHYVGDSYGVSGVELTMNDYLKGSPGMRSFLKDSKGKNLGTTLDQAPEIGSTVSLTLDAGLQAYTERILRKVGRGAAVVMDPQNGEILALASVPNYDPNDYIPSISQTIFSQYNNNRASPNTNRALTGLQPGSVFKLPVALAAAQAGNIGYRHNCRGYESYGRDGSLKIRCWLRSGHGTLGMSESIQRSCNPYFMSLANNLRSKRIVDMFSLLGFGKKTGVQTTGEKAGIIPGSLRWKRQIKPGASMTPATLAQLSIGQSDSLASPLQVASMVNAIANGGRYYKPRLIKEVSHHDKGILLEDAPEVKFDLLQEGITPGQLNVIRNGMWKAVNQQGGTAKKVIFDQSIKVAAKTGTAQTFDLGRRSNNAWVVGFAPYDDPQYVVCVMVQGGKSGGGVAGPIARELFRGAFRRDELKPEKMEKFMGNTEELEELEIEPLFSNNTLPSPEN